MGVETGDGREGEGAARSGDLGASGGHSLPKISGESGGGHFRSDGGFILGEGCLFGGLSRGDRGG